jgi:chromosome transmission fidelity protein 1
LNATYLKQLALLLKGLTEFAEDWKKVGKKEEMVQVGKLLEAKGTGGALDQINLRKLDEYLQRSKIARKVSNSGTLEKQSVIWLIEISFDLGSDRRLRR